MFALLFEFMLASPIIGLQPRENGPLHFKRLSAKSDHEVYFEKSIFLISWDFEALPLVLFNGNL